MSIKDDLKRAQAAELRNQVKKAGDEWQGLKNLVLELASEMETVKERLDLLEMKNAASPKEARRRPQSDSGE